MHPFFAQFEGKRGVRRIDTRYYKTTTARAAARGRLVASIEGIRNVRFEVEEFTSEDPKKPYVLILRIFIPTPKE